jgi:hypothetical protein
MNSTTSTRPPSPAALRHLADTELSVRSRVGHVALLVASLLMAIAIASLWLTEPALPLRAHVAFAAMVGIGLSWAGFSVWVLARRRVLLARHSVVAGRMAVTFTALFVVGALIVGYTSAGAGGYVAAGLGAVMLGVAIALLVRARRRFAALMERRQTLERELRGRRPGP